MPTNPLDVMADQIAGSLDTLKMTLADFADADLFVRPVPGANHAMWQLGHLVLAEHSFLKALAPDAEAAVPLPADWAAAFGKAAHGVDDPAKFPPRQAVLDHLTTVRKQFADAIRKLSPGDLARDTGVPFAPTVGRLALTVADHTMMHVGQFQVIRRKLGKPVLF